MILYTVPERIKLYDMKTMGFGGAFLWLLSDEGHFWCIVTDLALKAKYCSRFKSSSEA